MATTSFYNNGVTTTSQIALYGNDELENGRYSSPIPDQDEGPAQRPGGDVVAGSVNDNEDSNLTCGWFGCRPRWLQILNRPPWLLVALCFGTFLQGIIVNGFTPSSITSIERRFQLLSQNTGILVSVYDATNIIFVLFVVYVGGRRHKIRWVSVGCLLIGVAAFMYAIPHFTTDRYEYSNADNTAMCRPNRTSPDQCSAAEGSSASDLSNYIYLFGASQVVAGFGSLPMYTLGLAALDESISNENYGIYFGIFYAVGTLGPGCGFLLSGIFLNMFTELSIPPGEDLSPSDPGWVGAWWLGFVIAGVITLMVAIPLSLFPRELPGTAKIRSEKAIQAHANAGLEETSRPGFGKKPSDLLTALKYLIVNPTFAFTCLAGVPDALLINAFGAFLPKFFENQFGVTASLATILTGISVVVGGIIGTLNGGFVMRKLDLKVRGLLKWAMLCSVISGVLLLCVLLRCPQEKLAGVSVHYNNTRLTQASSINVTNTCNSACQCPVDQFIPVCVEGDILEYFTPCHAGCAVDNGNGTYSDCSCVSSIADVHPSSSVSLRKCQTACGYHPYVFTLLCTMAVIVVFSSVIPELNIVLRCVPETQRSMSLGVNSLIRRLLGAVPGPVLFGAVIDGACLLWQDTCGTRGSCWIYDSMSLAWRIAIIAVTLKAFGFCLYLCACACYRPAVEVGGTKGDADNQVEGDL